MISYDPKEWFMFIFRFHKADTFRKLFPIIVFVGLYTAGVAYIELEYLDLDMDKDSAVRHISVLHTLLGFALSMLLVFRTNTAYDRWWEGRKLWGSLVNNSRNLALKLAPILTDEDDRQFFKTAIPSYAFALRDHLRNEQTRIELFDVDLNTTFKPDIDKHLPNQVAKTLFEKIHQLHAENVLSGQQLLYINEELRAFTDICGACERIRNTPIPYSYSLFLKKFIFFYVMTLPISYVFSLSYYIVPIVPFIFYAMASLELIAEEIEEPFGHDSNDLPISRICDTINKHIGEILD
jgi:ion channel-forming bestrophin family protein